MQYNLRLENTIYMYGYGNKSKKLVEEKVMFLITQKWKHKEKANILDTYVDVCVVRP